MRPLKLRMKGFIGVKMGCGLDEITIDFADSNGLTALSGSNGSSKTTVLENTHPYPMLASRSGALYQHVFLRDSERELWFDFGGSAYKCLLKIDSESERSEGFLWRDRVPVVNGKISEYSRYIRELLGSPELFFASVFCAQNARKLSDLRTGEIKSLMVEFLQIEKLEGYAGTAKQKANTIKGSHDQLELQVDGLQAKADTKAALEESLLQAMRKNSELNLRLMDSAAGLVTIKADEETLRAQATDQAAQAEKLRGLKALATDKKKQVSEVATEVTDNVRSLLWSRKAIHAELSTSRALLTRRSIIAAAVERIQKLQAEKESLLSNRASNVETINALNTEMIGTQKRIGEKQSQIQTLNELARQLTSSKEIADTKALCASNAEKILLLSVRDPDCKSESCPFIKSSLLAQNAQPRAETRLKELVAEAHRSNERLIAEVYAKGINLEIDKRSFEESKAKIKQLLSQQGRLSAELDKLDSEVKQLTPIAAQSPSIATATGTIAGLKKRLAALAITDKVTRKRLKEKTSLLQSALAETQTEIEKIIIDSGLDNRLAKCLQTRADIESRIKLMTISLQESQTEIAIVNQKLGEATEADDQLKKLRTTSAALLSDLTEWRYLQNACGKDGLQALEIDGAAPLICGYANDMLSQAFGGDASTVRIATQDEAGRECFDIIVSGKDGVDVELSNLSGGEKVWVLMALRLAMTLLVKHKSGREFNSFFVDEMDGPLDSEKSEGFINLYRAMMRMGKFNDAFFISHKRDCVAMADRVLEFKHGANPRWV